MPGAAVATVTEEATEEMVQVDTSAVEAALDDLRPALGADGFDLRIGAISADGDVELVLEAKAGACLDCLVPEDMMVEILENAIHDRDKSFGAVTLVRVGFDDAEPH
jgi:hypothetical protein